METKPEVIFR